MTNSCTDLPSVKPFPDNQLPKLDVEGSSPFARSEGGSPVLGVLEERVFDAIVCHTRAEIYHGWPEVSCSQLKSLRDSSTSFYHRFECDQPEQSSTTKKAFAFGTVLHDWHELGADEFWRRVRVAPEHLCTATGAFGAKTKDWLSDLDPEAIPLSTADEKQLRYQTAEILKNRAAVKLLENAVDKEFNVRWQWGHHQCRCRVDGATATTFYDLKTTREKNILKDFGRSVDMYGYHLQAAYYGQAAKAMQWTDEPMQFVVTSTVYPHHCEVVVLPPHVMEEGRRECRRLLNELEGRRSFGQWVPSTYGTVHTLRCPSIRRRK